MGISFRNTGRVASVALALAVVRSVQAELTLDFRFGASPTNTTKVLGFGDGGIDVPVQVWATILGSGTLGILAAQFRAQSQQVGGGAFTSGGVTASAFTPMANFSDLFQAGSVGDVAAVDGITDLGPASGGVSVNDAKARALRAPIGSGQGVYNSGTGAVSWTAVSGGASIQLGSFMVHVGALTLGGGATRFNVALPTIPPVTSALWFENASSLNSQSGAMAAGTFGGVYSPGTAVTFAGIVGDPGPRYALTTHNNATLGTASSKSLAVIGSNGFYTDPGPASNYAAANSQSTDYAVANATLGVGNQNPVLVLVDFDLGSGTAAGLSGFFTNAGDVGASAIIGPGDADPSNLRGSMLLQYPSFNAHASHVMLFRFDNVGAVPNGMHFGYDSGLGPGILQAVVVPEPGTAGLSILGTLALLKRRRRVEGQGLGAKS